MNRPIPSLLLLLWQNESLCETIGIFFIFQFIFLFPFINFNFTNYNDNYAFGRQSRKLFCLFNQLTPVPPVTARDEPWPFFLFWCHHFWPKLASSVLNFCRRKRSFQRCPDRSDRPKGALDMHKNAQKVEWKLGAKFPATTPGCSMLKITRLDDALSEVF